MVFFNHDNYNDKIYVRVTLNLSINVVLIVSSNYLDL